MEEQQEKYNAKIKSLEYQLEKTQASLADSRKDARASKLLTKRQARRYKSKPTKDTRERIIKEVFLASRSSSIYPVFPCLLRLDPGGSRLRVLLIRKPLRVEQRTWKSMREDVKYRPEAEF